MIIGDTSLSHPNKALFPGLRMGYMVAPRPLLKALAVERHLSDRQPSSLTQAVLLDFMESGEFAAHIRRRRLAYQLDFRHRADPEDRGRLPHHRR